MNWEYEERLQGTGTQDQNCLKVVFGQIGLNQYCARILVSIFSTVPLIFYSSFKFSSILSFCILFEFSKAVSNPLPSIEKCTYMISKLFKSHWRPHLTLQKPIDHFSFRKLRENSSKFTSQYGKGNPKAARGFRINSTNRKKDPVRISQVLKAQIKFNSYMSSEYPAKEFYKGIKY